MTTSNKTYAVGIEDESGAGEITVICANKTEARATARLYIKQWRLRRARITHIAIMQTMQRGGEDVEIV